MEARRAGADGKRRGARARPRRPHARGGLRGASRGKGNKRFPRGTLGEREKGIRNALLVRCEYTKHRRRNGIFTQQDQINARETAQKTRGEAWKGRYHGMNNADFKDTRILEAFDYIDPKYIAEVAESLKLRSVRTTAEAPEMTWRTPFKHWKQFVALAACLILLSFASPVFNKVAEVISSFAAGWGSGTDNVSDTLEIPDITEEIVSDFDPNAILNEEDLAMLNAAWNDYFGMNYDYAKTIKQAMNKSAKSYKIFYGKCGDSIIVAEQQNITSSYFYVIGNYLFYYPQAYFIAVVNNNQFYSLYDAYREGILCYSDIIKISECHEEKFSALSDSYSGQYGGYINDDEVKKYKNGEYSTGKVYEKNENEN